MLPPTPAPAPFRFCLRVRYPECDPQGIAFNARYGDWTDLCTTELLRAIDPVWLEPGGFDYRLRAQHKEWMAPAVFDDVLVVEPTVTEVGRSSFVVQTTFCRASDGQPLARATTTYVRVDAAVGRSLALREDERQRLILGAPGRIADQAGEGGGRITGRVGREGWRSMAWKNGGGITHELHREGEGPAGFASRISIAEVGADGPFSRFDGVDRVLVLLSGAGMTLTRSDGLQVSLREGGDQISFFGEDDWGCALLGGPTLDLNLMTDRAQRRATAMLRPLGRVPAGLVLALAPGRIANEAVARHDLLRLDGPALASVPSISLRISAR